MASHVELTAEELYEEAPCGYVSTTLDGELLRFNRRFAALALGSGGAPPPSRLQQVLAPGGRIYYETHLAPLLAMQGEIREIALELRRPDETRVPVLANAVVRGGDSDGAAVVNWTVFAAGERRRYEQELLRRQAEARDAALALQQRLLSGELPRAETLSVVSAYRPSIAGDAIGGDWFDSFWLSEGESIALVVGDVVGRGLEAAATMAQLRSAVRALAATPHTPAALLEALDRYSRRHAVGYATTLLYATLRIADGMLCYACAGHPPPLVCGPGGATRFLWGGRSSPLGLGPALAAPRTEDSCELAHGSTVLLFTDGLIERREEPLDHGLQRLADALQGLCGAARSDAASALVEAMHAPDGLDDVCLLMSTITR